MGRRARLRAWLGAWAAAIMLLVACSAASAADWVPRVEAVRSDWRATEPPSTGWVPVTLPDDWGTRWPTFDGVVWYRLAWHDPAPAPDRALYVDRVTMAAEFRVNGVVIERDPSLVEPLSRRWGAPRYWRLPPDLLRAGRNEILVRVSGLGPYLPGLGEVVVGDADVLRDRRDAGIAVRRDLSLVSTAIVATLAAFFLVLWLLRRSEVAYGWFAAQQLAWLPVAWNMVAPGPWPFTDTHDYQSMTIACVLVFSATWGMFVLRFCGARWPKREAAMWTVVAVVCALMFAMPSLAMEHVRATRDGTMFLATIILSIFDFAFVLFAWRSRRTDHVVLAVCAVVSLVAGAHDALLASGLIAGSTYYASISVNLTVIGVALVLAWNFVRSLHRIEAFNVELRHAIDDARAELATTLSRQHELELMQARLGERVGLAHDLHDGLGGMLIGNIAVMEQAPDRPVAAREVVGMLKELRDDLRLIIDTASAQQHGEHSLGELLGPLRHRMARLFEAHEIAVRWKLDGLDDVYLDTTQSLDLLRILQEALTNVLKHSGARRVEVAMTAGGGELVLEIRDDGKGFGPADQGAGTGMRSMQARARRLDARLSVASREDGVVVHLAMRAPALAAHAGR